MLKKPVLPSQLSFLQPGLREQLFNRHPLYILANQIDWKVFEEAFKVHYREDFGRPAKPIRLMVALLMLKHIRNISDESVVEQWAENAYYQYFSGQHEFTPAEPCEASELVHFRNRIGQDGIELIFKESIRVNGKDAKEDRGSIDTTVQEKNITYPQTASCTVRSLKSVPVLQKNKNWCFARAIVLRSRSWVSTSASGTIPKMEQRHARQIKK